MSNISQKKQLWGRAVSESVQKMCFFKNRLTHQKIHPLYPTLRPSLKKSQTLDGWMEKIVATTFCLQCPRSVHALCSDQNRQLSLFYPLFPKRKSLYFCFYIIMHHSLHIVHHALHIMHHTIRIMWHALHIMHQYVWRCIY